MSPAWRDLPFGPGLRQPDGLSCGAASLVVARMALEPSYAAWALRRSGPGFAAEVLAVHRRVTGPTDGAGRAQVPWPRALGTPPWAVARELSATGRAYATRWARTGRGRAFDGLLAGVRAGHPAVLFIGSPWLPRHVVVALGPDGPDGRGDETLAVYDPARGTLRTTTRESFTMAEPRLLGWPIPWFVVRPVSPR